MRDELRYIGKKIIQNDLALAKAVDDIQDNDYKQRLESSGFPALEFTEYRAELLRYFGEALYMNFEETVEKVNAWGEKVANKAIYYNISLSDSLIAISNYRTVIWNVFTEELEQRKFAARTMLDVSKIIDPLFDKVSRIFGEAYEDNSKRLMAIAYTALEELSVPVVPITTGIAVIPLVGAIDTYRAQLIMETALTEGARLKISHFILDISGVLIIDTMVADQIFQIVKALKLIGIQTILTGIRPEIAQTIVSLGLNFNKIKTHASLKQALKELGFKHIKIC
ncbi:STAS domain-containing protein [Domibacillus tundrae]|uniref:STAS domain-containing protein n=1 Tax=Domibacillus tundrae TaxID=1587527 RepID=UPI000617F58A|nr:STAS domain-containing protein [Domibacillus tundrae]